MTTPGTASALVGLGGLAGSVARYGLSLLAQRLSFEWPAGTLAANLVGCFLIGAIAELAGRGDSLSPEARLLLATGFCGGFTTMSSFVYEAAQFLKSGEYFNASLYFGATLAGSMVAFFVGVVLVRLFIKSAGALWN
jgi:fluoride exporter